LKVIRTDLWQLLFTGLWLLLIAANTRVLAAQKTTSHTADGSGAFATGHYRDLFAEAGHSQRDVSRKIKSAYKQLFHGDSQTQAVFFWAGKNATGRLAYITDWNNHDVRAEGMSYGMMISVQLNKTKEFNALWNWARTYMYIGDPNHPSYGYFSWSCKTDGTPHEETAAPDGEEYFVMSLYFAANRWGSGKGIYDCRREADELLSNMRHRKEKAGPTKFGMRLVVAKVNEQYRRIRFVPSITRGDFADPSYHLPAFYELWARWGPPEGREFWAEAAQASREFFVKTTDPQTGLAPVYANFDGTPHPTRFPQSAIFGYDAWRTASNWSVDWSWW
jgi:oligosaccharide reducing-end xylanase